MLYYRGYLALTHDAVLPLLDNIITATGYDTIVIIDFSLYPDTIYYLATLRIQITYLYSSYSFYNYSIIATQTAFKYRYSLYATTFALKENLRSEEL